MNLQADSKRFDAGLRNAQLQLEKLHLDVFDFLQKQPDASTAELIRFITDKATNAKTTIDKRR